MRLKKGIVHQNIRAANWTQEDANSIQLTFAGGRQSTDFSRAFSVIAKSPTKVGTLTPAKFRAIYNHI